MSVINQMLNGLEQRGVPVATGQLRTVQITKKYQKIKFGLLAGLLVLFTALLWRDIDAPAPPKKLPVAFKPISVAPVIVAVSAIAPVEVKSVPAVPAPKIHPEKQLEPTVKAVNQVKTVPPVKPATKPVVNEATRPSVVPVTSPSGAVKQVSQAQQADAEFHKATVFMQQGRSVEAQAGFEAALRAEAGLDAARHALVTLLLEGKRNTEAEQVLQDGLKVRPANSGYAMLLARLQVQRGELDQALLTLALTLPYAVQQADYQAFYAALLQRRARHKEAVEHYQVALKASPNSGVWLMGCGISLQALGKNDEAKEAFAHALSSKTLSPELQAFVQQKMKAL